MKNKFLELVNNPIFNVDSTVRYSGVYQVRPESLSHHITDVSLLAYVLTLKLNTLGEDLDKGLVLEKVLLHDLDEVLTGDIPRSTKYYSKDGLVAMQGVADDAIVQLTNLIEGGEGIYKVWDEAKSEKEGLVLKLADMLCVTRKVIVEVEMLGNKYFLKVAYEVQDYLKQLSSSLHLEDFNSASKEYISELIDGSLSVLSEVVSKYEHEFNTYGIVNNVFYKVNA